MKSAMIMLCEMIVFMGCSVTMSLADDATSKTTPTKAVVKAVPEQTAKAADSSEAQQIVNSTLFVYYFHGDKRCSNCIKLESYTKEAVDSAYANPLKDSLIVWRVINTDEDANKHYRDDYQLYTKSVVLSEVRAGKEVRWKNLEKVWDYLGDKAAFKSYICDEVASFMKAR
jgi:hypothetical protein